MLRIMRCLFLITFFFIAYYGLCIAGFDSAVYAQTQSSPGQAEILQELSPEQRNAVETEFSKTGGVTPEAIKALKDRPEFKGITPGDIAKGKEILEKKEVGEKEPEKEEKEIKETGKTIPGEKKAKSLFDRYRVVGSYQDISTTLRPFGYEFFSEAFAKSLTPRKDIPVSSDYIIGPGDEVKILLWGRLNAQHKLVVNRDGDITIPQIGPLHVAGMSFAQMEKFLREQAEQIIGAKINITMGTLKSIQVFVLGEARRPGTYALDSFSTITNAILAAGGPTEIGSLRNLQLKRNDHPVSVMDFYDFLLKGDKSQDKVLHSGDVVFIPIVGPLVGIAGNVKRPAIYELKKKYDLRGLFDMAGGIIPSAYTQQIQVERIQKNVKQIVIDIDDKNLTKSKDFMLQDGDLVKIFSITDKDTNVVYLNGNVKRPGKYEHKYGMRVKDLIKAPTDLLKETCFDYALIKRQNPPGLESQLIPFNLGKILFDNDTINNIKLQPQDMIYIFSEWFFKDKPSITVEGEVRRGGKFNLPGNYKIKDAILEAGGLTNDANLKKGEILRLNEQREVTQIYFNVGLAMTEDPEENILLQSEDKVIIHSIWEGKYKQTVSVEGDVNNPGEYPLARDMRISDLIFTAGNILESAYLDEAEVSSYTMDAKRKSGRMDYRNINLGLALEKDPAHDLVLKPYDRIFLKRIPGWLEERFITISGEFKFPGKYIIKEGEKLSSVIERAGGFTDKTYLRGAIFTREQVRKLQQKSLDEMILRLERELRIKGSLEASTALSKNELETEKVELEQRQKFIESLKEVKATGRMLIRLAHLRLLKGSEYDIELEDGDTLYIPVKNSVVNVMGAVMSRASFVYSEELDYKDYIEMTGGYTKHADTDNLYVLKVDGSAKRLSRGWFTWNTSKSRWEVSAFGEEIKEIEPGDTIVVPEELEHIAWLREIKDITQILYQIAVTAGVSIALF